MRLGIYGGSFDPVHVGHLILADQCRHACQLDEVWWIPTGKPPHKNSRRLAEGKSRTEMLELATAGYPEFVIEAMELERVGTTYTVDTLQQLHDQDAYRELFLLIGADSLADMRTWREPARIAELATIVVVNRGDRPIPDLDRSDQQRDPWLSQVQRVTIPGIDVSATDIRARIRSGQSIRFLLPRAVEAYIREHKLYS